MKPVRVAAIQTRAGGVDPSYVGKIVSSAGDVDLVILPELWHLPYFPLERIAEWHGKAIELDSPFVRQVETIAHDHQCYLVLPLFLKEGNTNYNAVLIIGPDGSHLPGREVTRGRPAITYKKTHLCDVRFYGAGFYESSYFSAGASLVLWETEFAKVGVLICYDRHFPEAWRTLRAAGAEIVCVPIASPSATEPTFVAEMQAMALQQGVFAVVANRAGKETLPSSGLTTEYLGRSSILGPDGSVLAVAPGTQPDVVVSATLDPDMLQRTRSGLPLARHRRPEIYLLEPRE
jgi:N-carbamoylputrescine amidase